jgi:hypothetical protein
MRLLTSVIAGHSMPERAEGRTKPTDVKLVTRGRLEKTDHTGGGAVFGEGECVWSLRLPKVTYELSMIAAMMAPGQRAGKVGKKRKGRGVEKPTVWSSCDADGIFGRVPGLA